MGKEVIRTTPLLDTRGVSRRHSFVDFYSPRNREAPPPPRRTDPNIGKLAADAGGIYGIEIIAPKLAPQRFADEIFEEPVFDPTIIKLRKLINTRVDEAIASQANVRTKEFAERAGRKKMVDEIIREEVERYKLLYPNKHGDYKDYAERRFGLKRYHTPDKDGKVRGDEFLEQVIGPIRLRSREGTPEREETARKTEERTKKFLRNSAGITTQAKHTISDYQKARETSSFTGKMKGLFKTVARFFGR